MKHVLRACRWIFNYLRDYSCGFRMNSQLSHTGRIWAKRLVLNMVDLGKCRKSLHTPWSSGKLHCSAEILELWPMVLLGRISGCSALFVFVPPNPSPIPSALGSATCSVSSCDWFRLHELARWWWQQNLHFWSRGCRLECFDWQFSDWIYILPDELRSFQQRLKIPKENCCQLWCVKVFVARYLSHNP